MSKTLLVILFFVGFFAGLALGALWGVSVGMREVSSALEELKADHAGTRADLTIIKAKE